MTCEVQGFISDRKQNDTISGMDLATIKASAQDRTHVRGATPLEFIDQPE
ncbi:MAG: hypothetical protein GDA52_09620 [Rhodobacteraceae bacterium]|nr:hypothetical protein [Paracoccaceae bacterium]